MKFTSLCFAILAAAGLAMFTGCGDTSEPTFSERELETTEDVATETPAEQDVQYGSPERQPDTRFDADVEGEAEFITPEGEEGEIEVDDGRTEIDM